VSSRSADDSSTDLVWQKMTERRGRQPLGGLVDLENLKGSEVGLPGIRKSYGKDMVWKGTEQAWSPGYKSISRRYTWRPRKPAMRVEESQILGDPRMPRHTFATGAQ
jgi:hypothetical protein